MMNDDEPKGKTPTPDEIMGKGWDPQYDIRGDSEDVQRLIAKTLMSIADTLNSIDTTLEEIRYFMLRKA